jgi:hypothetical protein
MIAGGLDGVIRAFDSNSGCAGWPEAPAVSKGVILLNNLLRQYV